MGISRPAMLALCTTALAAALTLPTAAPALAAPGMPLERGRVDVQITPVSPRPGDTVEISVGGCKSDKNATAHSEAFVSEVPLGHLPGGLIGEGRISSSIAPGVYSVDVSCDGKAKAGSARMVVTGHVDPEPTKRPTAPVRAGGGGAAEEQDEQLAQPAAGPADHITAPFGVTVLAGGLLAGAVVLAARRRSVHRDGR